MTTVLNDLITWVRDLGKIIFLSATSPKFYTDNFKNYTGYGIKYLLTISMICAIFVCWSILHATNILNEYFINGKVSEKVATLDHVINQIPVLEYNGKKISSNDKMPVTINTPSNEPVVIIDPENKTPYNKRSKVPIYMGSDQIVVDGEIIGPVKLQYVSMLGSEKITINQEFIRTFFANLMSSAPNVIIFTAYPLLSLLILSYIILQDVISIIIISVLFYLYKSKMYLQNCIRVIFFSSGVTLLYKILISTFLPLLSSAVWMIELWINFLVVVGLFNVLFDKKGNK